MAKTQGTWFNPSPVNKGYISLKQMKTKEEIKKVNRSLLELWLKKCP